MPRMRYPDEMREKATALRAQGLGLKAIAEELGIAVATASDWLRGTPHKKPVKPTLKESPRRKMFWLVNRLTDDQILEMRQLKTEGWPTPKLAERYQINEKSVGRVLHGEVRPDLPGVIPLRRWRARGDQTPEGHQEAIRQRKREYSKHYRESRRNDPTRRANARESAKNYRRLDGVGGWAVPENSVCALCGAPDRDVPFKSNVGEMTTRRLLVMDHDHATGVVRDPLCHRCNQLLGMVEHDPEKFQRMFAYLEKWRGKPPLP